MVAPILIFTNYCCKKIPDNTQTCKNIHDKAVVGALALDALISITSFVIGILGLTGSLPLLPGASYGLIGLSAGITAIYLGLAAKKCCEKSCLREPYQPNLRTKDQVF